MLRRFWFAAAAVLAITIAVAACAPDAEDTGQVDAPKVVRISGSGTCLPMLRLLTDTYDGRDIDWQYLPGVHSQGGVTAVAEGELEIGAVSRDLTPEEEAAGLTYTRLATDAIVFAVHPSVGLTGLTTMQVRDIYAGVYSNWSELGGADLPMTVLDRNEDDSGKIYMREYVFGPDLVMGSRVVQLYHQDEMVQGLQSTVGAIGYFSLGTAVSQDVPVTLLALDGVEPTVENVRSGAYPLVRPLGVVTSPDAGPEISAFLDWATSDRAAEIIETNGYTAAR